MLEITGSVSTFKAAQLEPGRDALRGVLQRHSEYLLEIPMSLVKN